jgi:hypothetical protein
MPRLPQPPFLLQWHAAIDYVRSAALADVLADFDGIDATVMDILQRYQVGGQGWLRAWQAEDVLGNR